MPPDSPDPERPGFASSLVPDSARRWFLRLFPLVAIFVATYLIYYGFRNYARVIDDFPLDAYIDHGGASVLAAGRNPYTPEGLAEFNMTPDHGLGHPPTTLVWFLPLVSSDLYQMKVIWNELTVFLLALELWLVTRTLQIKQSLFLVPLVFGAVLATSFMTNHLNVVQLSMLIAFLYAAAWALLRDGREISAGAALGLACTLKFYPATVVFFFLVRRRFRVVFGAIGAWLVFALYVTPKVGIFGWTAFLEQTAPYTKLWMFSVRNSTILGVIQRLAWPLCEYPPGEHELWRAGSILATGVSLALLGALLWLSRKNPLLGPDVDVPFCLFTLASLITGPYMWEHYNVTLILPFFVALTMLLRMPEPAMSWRLFVPCLLGLVVIVCVLEIQINDKIRVWTEYPTHPGTHFKLHALEIANWISTPLLMTILVFLERARARFRVPDASQTAPS